MGLELAKAWVSVRGDVSNLAGDLTGAHGPVDAVLNKITFKINSAISAIGALGYSFLDMGVRAAASQEQTVIAFETMMGSIEAAKKLLADLTHFAEVTPFEMPEITAAARGLVQFGERGDQLMETLKILGNAASGANTDFSFLALVFNQVRGVGHLLTQDFRQMSTRGVLSLQDIADYYGKTTHEAEKLLSTGKVGFEDLRNIFIKLSAEGGRFHNLMEKQSKTLGGLWSTMKDAYHIAARLIATPIAEALKPVVSIMLHITESAGPLINAFQKGMGPLISAWKELGDVIIAAWDKIDMKGAAESIKKALDVASDHVATFSDALKTDWKTTWKVLGDIAKAELDIAWTSLKMSFFDMTVDMKTSYLIEFNQLCSGMSVLWLDAVQGMQGVFEQFTEGMGQAFYDGFEEVIKGMGVFTFMLNDAFEFLGIISSEQAKLNKEVTEKQVEGIVGTGSKDEQEAREGMRAAATEKKKADLEEKRLATLAEIVNLEKIRAAAIQNQMQNELAANKNVRDILIGAKEKEKDKAVEEFKGIAPPRSAFNPFSPTDPFSEPAGMGMTRVPPPKNLSSFASSEEPESMLPAGSMILNKEGRNRALRERQRLLDRFSKKEEESPASVAGSPFGTAFDKGGGMVGFSEYGKLLQNSILKAGTSDPVVTELQSMKKVLDESKEIQGKILEKNPVMGLAAG